MNAGPLLEPIQTITGLPRAIRFAFQLSEFVSIRIWPSAVAMNQTRAALLWLPSLRTVAI